MTARADERVAGVFFVLALVIGGAGLAFPMLQLALGIAALGLAAMLVLRPMPFRVQFAKPLLALLAAAFVLPLAQLIPLPPGVWQSLPGRQGVIELDAILGWQHWRPWTLDIEGTVRATLVMIPGAVMFLACLRMGTEARVRLLYLFVGVALFGALLGLIQLVSGGRLTPYPSGHSGFPLGLFVNRNHQAVFLLAAMPVAAALGATRLPPGKARTAGLTITLSVLLILAIMTVATTSRMALILLPAMLFVALAILFFGQSTVRMILPGTAIVVAAALALWFGGGLNRNFARFATLGDARFDFWTDVAWALEQYGVAGTGIGTFVPVHKTAESLETISPAIVNHAHNDYLELLLEGGVAALLLVGIFLALLASGVVRKIRAQEGRQRLLLGVASGAGIAAILLSSLVDYPLRMPAIQVVFALLVVTLMPSAHRRGGLPSTEFAPRGGKRRAATVAALAVLAGTAIVMVQAAVSKSLLLRGQIGHAVQWAPWSTEARSAQASKALVEEQDVGKAAQAAAAALRLSPIDAPAVRNVGLMAAVSGYAERSAQLMRLATVLGWRDSVANLWAIEAAVRSNDPVKAVQRAEAMYRQDQFVPAATAALLEPPLAARTTPLLLRSLEARPVWRRGFLGSAGALPAQALPAFEELVVALNQRSPVTIDEATPLLDQLAKSGRAPERTRLWLALRRTGLIANGGFERIDADRDKNVPGDWISGSGSLVSFRLDRPGDGGKGVALRFSQGRANRPLILQKMMLPAGAYALTFRARTADAGGVTMRWHLRCDGGRSSSLELAAPPNSPWRSFAAAVVVPAQNCADQLLSFQLDGMSAKSTIWLDNVALRQSARAAR